MITKKLSTFARALLYNRKTDASDKAQEIIDKDILDFPETWTELKQMITYSILREQVREGINT